MKVLIIEDEAPAFRRLQRILEEILPKVEILEVIDSVEDSVKWLRNHRQPDLIFMDIQLADGLSFDIFSEIKVQAPVIFTTAYDEYTLKAFKVNSIDYLLKPINKELLKDSIDKFHSLKEAFSNGPQIDFHEILKTIQPGQKRFKSRFLIKVRDQLISLEAKKIAYFYTKNGLVFARTKQNKKYLVDYTLDELEDCLDPQHFYRLNRQHLSSFDAIAASYQWDKGKLKVELIPATDDLVLISREKAGDFKKWLDLF